MKVKAKQLKTGCIVTKDVLSLTNDPIIKKDTILNDEHLTILKVFQIDTVEVKQVLANDEPFEPLEVTEKQELVMENENDFISTYLGAVNQYKKAFKSWEAGNQVNYFSILEILKPLFQQTLHSPEYLLHLHRYSKRDEHVYYHSIYVAVLSAYLGHKLSYSKADTYIIGMIGALADSGMAKFPHTIFKKDSLLTATEREEVRKHPVHSYKMLKDVAGVTDSILIAVLQHHERLDGSGYPMGTKAMKIHIFSQIVAVADVYHTKVSECYYNSKCSPYQVLEEISQEQFGQLGITAVEALIQSFFQISIGTRVRLTSGEEAEIVFFEQQIPAKPMVRLLSSGEVIQLTKATNLHIQEIISR